VCFDKNGGERSWWLAPVHAEALGERLLAAGTECREFNDHEARRIASGPPNIPKVSSEPAYRMPAVGAACS
jgi:hypothetical protein